MGPKKKQVPKSEQEKFSLIDDQLNSNTWKCAVVMAVERTTLDSFVLRFFTEEAVRGLRQDVKHIDLDSFVLKILQEFANGELPFKYMYLLNFQNIFQEAADFVKKKMDVPIPLLAKVVKALLFFLRHESITRNEKKAQVMREPIQAMAERPTFLGEEDVKEKPVEQKTGEKEGKNKGKDKVKSNEGGGLKVRPPSSFKLESSLTKRGESAAHSQCIDDAPPDGYFQMYVLLTGFYDPDFPMELLKAEVPLHGLICIDTSLSGKKQVSDSGVLKLKKKSGEEKIMEVQRFWDTFLKFLWNPSTARIFKDTIFQVYVPRMLLCGEKQLKEFIYREISYLMYDLSDFKKQLHVYLESMKLWNVREKEKYLVTQSEVVDDLGDLHCECVTVPVVLQQVFNFICGYEDFESVDSSHSDGKSEASEGENKFIKNLPSESVLAKYGSFAPTPMLSQIIDTAHDYNKAVISAKIKELDIKYNLDDRSYFYTPLGKFYNDIFNEENFCKFKKIGVTGENMERALNTEDGVFASYWKNYPKKEDSFSFGWDYCLCALLACRVLCPFELPPPFPSIKSSRIFKRNSTLEMINNIDEEMGKPHFSVTEGSRSILKSFPYNMKDTSKNFFCCSEYKVVTPKKLKASSAPEFLVSPKLYTQTSYCSELLYPKEIFEMEKCELNVFQNIREFLGEEVFENINEFYFLEELSKPKLLSKEYEFWDSYNCIDCNFSVLLDSLFLVLHNRSDGENTHHETFNETLRTAVGLRDFFEYVLEDESEWFKAYEKSYKSNLTILAQKSFQEEMFKNVTDSDFLLENSIKYQERIKNNLEIKKLSKKELNKSAADKTIKKDMNKESNEGVNSGSDIFRIFGSYDFEGYDVEDIAVQFSGLKTLYCVEDCRLSVQLLERLYGDQYLGIQVHLGGHNLYLYSYACPVPHIRHPYTFNVTYKNGIIVAFGRRLKNEAEEVALGMNSKDSMKKFSTLSAIGSSRPTKNGFSTLTEVEFLYDMSLSLPNGLTVKTVRSIINPCYVKQQYLVRNNKYSETVQSEKSRIFLPNGNVIKMMVNDTVQVLKSDTSIVTIKLSSLVKDTSESSLNSTFTLKDYDIVTASGYQYVVEKDKIVSSKRHPIFKKSDLQADTIYYRRKDGTNFMEQGNGTICMQFTDNTRISKSVFTEETIYDNYSFFSYGEESIFESVEEESINEDEFIERDYVIVHYEVVFEHPDYATIKFNSQNEIWKIVLPFDSTITVSPSGQYFVEIDKQTELGVDQNQIKMTRYKTEESRQPYCSVTADLEVFKNKENNMYCQMRDGLGKVFVVEPNANCYSFVDEGVKDISQELIHDKNSRTRSSELSTTNSSVATSKPTSTKNDQRNTSKTLESSSSTMNEVSMRRDMDSFQSDYVNEDNVMNEIFYGSNIRYDNPGKKLSRKNKYFIVKRDITGYEILHKSDIEAAFEEARDEAMIFTQDIPGMKGVRCFTLLEPAKDPKNKFHKWEVESILPDPKYVPGVKFATTSSTYGDPPSWLFPFAKKPKKVELPENLSCRVFIETKPTDVQLPLRGATAHDNIEFPEPKYTIIKPGMDNIQNYLKKLANNDQNILKEMYLLSIKKLKEDSLLRHEKNLHEKSIYYDKLNRCQQEKSHYEMEEYYQQCIRYNIIPNFFQHPLGMSWLILNKLVDQLLLPDKGEDSSKVVKPEIPISVRSTSEFSYEEIEYNLIAESIGSYSELSFRSKLSAITAPILRQPDKEQYLFKYRILRKTVSCPNILLGENRTDENERDPEIYEKYSTCHFGFGEIEKIYKDRKNDSGDMTVNDLMSLGLI